MRNRYSKNSMNRRRRQLQVRRNICMLALSVMAVVLLSIFMISISTQASGLGHNTAPYKYYKSIEVSKGDTLWSIAKEHIDTDYYETVSDYVNEIKTMNAIKSDHIVAGSSLIIPYYSPGSAYKAQ